MGNILSHLYNPEHKNDGTKNLSASRCFDLPKPMINWLSSARQIHRELMDGPAPFFRTAFVDIGVDMEALPYPSPANAE
ncbi:hypothetical protein CEXT_300111 [Caerostris extrusa]|uniref:Uncharacterized protein n=1 Tax=Caerostris extrusa TaxID=172846 RepID=A0AAV4NRC8_CAEEX|nr:hypothetical protein CEXT_300111 [Caerostris extrusa]